MLKNASGLYIYLEHTPLLGKSIFWLYAKGFFTDPSHDVPFLGVLKGGGSQTLNLPSMQMACISL